MAHHASDALHFFFGQCLADSIITRWGDRLA